MALQTPYLDVQHLTKSFGAHLLFRDISFSIAAGQKIGLVAKNGTGKSTLLSVITGKEGYDSGEIIYRNDLRTGYLEQSPLFDENESVLDACFNHHGDPERVLKAKQILTQLHISNLEQPMGQLSGGQQKRVALANVLITDPDLLILDEPTNHLDLEMIEWLEGYLNRGNKTLLMVTHDRFFLDSIVDHLFVMSGDGLIRDFPGSYSDYRAYLRSQAQEASAKTPAKAPAKTRTAQRPPRLTYKEQQELAALEKSMEKMNEEKSKLEAIFNGTAETSEDISALATRYAALKDELDEAELRWLELSEKGSAS